MSTSSADATESSFNVDWVVGGRSMGDFLKQYREVSKSGAEQLSDSRILSLSHIFLFNIDHKTSCTHLMEPDEHQAILDNLDIRQGWTPIFDDAVTWCLKLDRQLKSTSSMKANIREAKKTTMLLWMQHNDEQERRVFVDTLLSVTDTFENWMDDCDYKPTYIIQRIMPFFSNIFEKDGKLGDWCVSGNKNDLVNTETPLADCSVFYHSTSLQLFNLIAIEIKSIGKSSCGQSQSDLVKLGNEMKCMVDRLVDARVDKVVVGGILIEDDSCSTYIMDLNYDGVYRMTQLARFTLLRGPCDIMLVPGIMEYFCQLKSILLETAISIENKRKNNSNTTTTSSSSSSNTVSPTTRKRKACGTPK